ncbi:MAG: hypothetical protein ACOVNL_07995 [Prochlorococcaceae cyanobacterium]|jgi:hypothetical protein
MNDLVLSLALAALSQLSGFGGLGGALGGGLGGGFGNGLLGGLGGGFGNGLGGVPRGAPAPDFRSAPIPVIPLASRSGGSERGRQLATLAVVGCLVEDGRLDGSQARSLLNHQSRRRGWPLGWERRFSSAEMAGLVRSSGGCDPLMARLGRRSGNPGSGSIASSRSEQESFGLTPYR